MGGGGVGAKTSHFSIEVTTPISYCTSLRPRYLFSSLTPMHRAVGGGGTGCRAAASIPPRPSPTPDRGQSSNRRSSDPKGEKGAGWTRDDDKIAGTLFCWPGKIPQIFAFARPVISPRSASGFVKTSQATVNPARPNPPLVFFFLSYTSPLFSFRRYRRLWNRYLGGSDRQTAK